MPPLVVPIVEGFGEIEAFPVLLRRLANQLEVYPKINPPTRVRAGSFFNDRDYFHKYVTLAADKAAQSPTEGIVVILLDCEDACPGVLGPEILMRARSIRADVEFLVALAYREYETWFLAAAESLRDHSGLPNDLVPPADPESIRGAKAWLSARMPAGYDPLNHQASFTQQMDLALAGRVPSFQRLAGKLLAYFSRFQSGNAETELEET